MDAEKKGLIEEICEMEYTLFDKVQNEGKRAACQDNKTVFKIMRSAQFHVWSMKSLKSWRQDLIRAISEGRNPFSEKYGYMMESTYPAGYEKITLFHTGY